VKKGKDEKEGQNEKDKEVNERKNIMKEKSEEKFFRSQPIPRAIYGPAGLGAMGCFQS
jgi:hypothetical protein